jgi:hypothetical protein
MEKKNYALWALPSKPEFPAGGSWLECTNCRRASLFQQSQLMLPAPERIPSLTRCGSRPSQETSTALVAASLSCYVADWGKTLPCLYLLRQSCVHGAATTGRWNFQVSCYGSKSGYERRSSDQLLKNDFPGLGSIVV